MIINLLAQKLGAIPQTLCTGYAPGLFLTPSMQTVFCFYQQKTKLKIIMQRFSIRTNNQ